MTRFATLSPATDNPPSKAARVLRSSITPASAEIMPPASCVQVVMKFTVSWKPSLRVTVYSVANTTRMA